MAVYIFQYIYCITASLMVLCIHNTKERRDFMFLVTWIEGEEVNYRLVMKQELSTLMAATALGKHAIVQKLTF